MWIRKLILGYSSAALIAVAGPAEAFSPSHATAVAAAVGDTQPLSSANRAASQTRSLTIGRQHRTEFSWDNFASEPAGAAQKPLDKDAVTLRFLFGGSLSADDRAIADAVAEMKAPPKTAPLATACTMDGTCRVTAAAVPGPIWLVVSALIGLLAVRTRRPRLSAA